MTRSQAVARYDRRPYCLSLTADYIWTAVFEIGLNHIWVITLTFHCHVTSSLTWPFDSP